VLPGTLDYEYVLVGGGLQNGLIALAIRASQPEARIAMIERGDAPGGNHTWCFHARDVTASAQVWIDPIVAVRWPGYDVMFSDYERRLDTPYACVQSANLAQCVTAALAEPGSRLYARSIAIEVRANGVTVRDEGNREHELHATAVIDARGPSCVASDNCAWQKFVGQELVVGAPHGLDRPILMDARVEQSDGFRFFYVLPLAFDRLLVEDTYFSDRADLDVGSLRREIAAYCDRRGWSLTRVVREETGLLPMPLNPTPPTVRAPLVAGYAGGWFHPVTAYSFPIAARLAAFVASRPAEALIGDELHSLARIHGRQLAFGGRLNRMMFRWYPPAKRHHVLARFYQRSPALIERFYALELTAMDRARMFMGRPPKGLSLRAALGGAI
jgi:lycopene beta-cyclase